MSNQKVVRVINQPYVVFAFLTGTLLLSCRSESVPSGASPLSVGEMERSVEHRFIRLTEHMADMTVAPSADPEPHRIRDSVTGITFVLLEIRCPSAANGVVATLSDPDPPANPNGLPIFLPRRTIKGSHPPRRVYFSESLVTNRQLSRMLSIPESIGPRAPVSSDRIDEPATKLLWEEAFAAAMAADFRLQTVCEWQECVAMYGSGVFSEEAKASESARSIDSPARSVRFERTWAEWTLDPALNCFSVKDFATGVPRAHAFVGGEEIAYFAGLEVDRVHGVMPQGVAPDFVGMRVVLELSVFHEQGGAR